MQRPEASLLLVLRQQAGWEWIASQPHASAHNLLLDWAFTGGAFEDLYLVFLLPTHSYNPDRISPRFGNPGTMCETCERLLQASKPMLPATDGCLLCMCCWFSSSGNL